MRFSTQELLDGVSLFSKARVLVVGDIILDQYTFGETERLSPEAPIPVLKKIKDEYTLGGAANVAANVASLGGEVTLAGVIGRDDYAQILKNLLACARVSPSALISHKTRGTILKQRLVAGNHQLLRVDIEDPSKYEEEIYKEMFEKIKKLMKKVSVVVLSDYDKGCFSKTFTEAVIKEAKRLKRFIIADCKPSNLHFFSDADLLTPNFKEGKEMTGERESSAIGKSLLKKTKANILLTRGAEGMDLFLRKEAMVHIPAHPVEVFDVSGAGDTVVAVMALAVASGSDLNKAATIATAAASNVVSKMGTATVGIDELYVALDFQ